MARDLRSLSKEDHHLFEYNFTSRFPMKDRFYREDQRLITFDCWPLKWISKRELAMTGMFFTGKDDKTKCYFCQVEVFNWTPGDDPLTEHLRWSPNCALLRGCCTNNIPINQNALEEILPPLNYDTCGLNDIPQINSRAKCDDDGNDDRKISSNNRIYTIEIPISLEISSPEMKFVEHFPIRQLILFILFLILILISLLSLFVLEYVGK